jgi:hypothetical protein
MSRLRCRSLVLISVLTTAAVLSGVGPAAHVDRALAQSDTTVDTRPVIDDGSSPAGNILPRPNTGQAPDSPNDPGGWQQYLVFGLILGGLALIAALVVRESRKARHARSG